MTDLPPSVAVGQVIDGKYRIDRIIGTGGMGVVVAAEHLKLGRQVALKFLLKQAIESREAVSRFQREARALAQITSAHVARVMDVGALEHGEPYLVLEYLEGSDLSAVLKQRGQLPVGEAVDYVLQACEAVAEAHAHGIIHRDLKPSNLFLTRGADGEPLIKVLDFGISKAIVQRAEGGDDSASPDATTAAATHETNTGALVGSPLYMSPEQIRSPRNVDARTDIWSFGVLLYELLCARRPFVGETLAGTLAAVAADPPTPMRDLRPDVSAELEAIMLKCLEKAPSRRYGSLAELAQALARYASSDARSYVDRIARMLGAGSGSRPAVKMPALSLEDRVATVPTWEGKTMPPGAVAPSQLRGRLPLVLAASAGAVTATLLWLGSAEPPTASPVPAVDHPSSATAPVREPASVVSDSTAAAAPTPALPAASSAATPAGSEQAPPPKTAKPGKPVKPAPPAPSSSGAPSKPPVKDDDGTADRK